MNKVHCSFLLMTRGSCVAYWTCDVTHYFESSHMCMLTQLIGYVYYRYTKVFFIMLRYDGTQTSFFSIKYNIMHKTQTFLWIYQQFHNHEVANFLYKFKIALPGCPILMIYRCIIIQVYDTPSGLRTNYSIINT